MFDIFFNRANELHRRGEPFAMAVVVRREAPISGRPGDKAIIEADGSIHGWIGGGCTQPIVVKEAQKALRDGKSKLIRITPTSSEIPQDGVIEYTMTCQSGGALDIYIEPVMPRPRIIIMGQSSVARALVRLASVVHYGVVAAAPGATEESFPEADRVLADFDLATLQPLGRACVVVSTQGEGDEEALLQVSALDVPYAAFVASKTKAAALFETLRAKNGLGPYWQRIKVPAGLDIQAKTPEEIAVSILAEVIQVLAATGDRLETSPQPDPNHLRELLPIEEMTCHHCVLAVERALRSIEGLTVHDVEIGSASISYDPSAVDRRQIMARIEELGYRVGD